MSTLSGIASKGEKGRSKFHSLDINYLYRGESLEPHQQKNIAHQRKHGMQTLGKVPATRRAPANLPSLKSEHSGNDPAYSLVPTGGTGWGSKPGETGPPPSSTTSTTPTTATTTQSTPTIPAQSAPAPLSAPASGSSTPTTTTTTPVQQPPQQQQQPTTGTTSHVHDKSWSAIMSNSSNEAVPNFLAHQSPSFQQEFPSLFGETTGTSGTTVKSDNQYGPGPSLRPQTEGSWSQGGSRPQAPIGGTAGSQTVTAPAQGPLHHPPGPELGGVRSSLGPSGVGGGPAGPPHQTPHMLPAHFKGVMPPFMFRPNYPGGFPQNFQGPVHGPTRPRFPYMPDRMMGAPRAAASGGDTEEMTPRPIIKEEDLNRMDDVARDVGWATHDDIDYNQKLAFSDDETGQDDESSNTRSGRDGKGTRSPPHQQNRDRERDKEQPVVVDRERDTDSGDRDDRASSREKLSIVDSRSWQNRPPASLISSFGSQGMRPQQGNRGVEDEDFWREKRRQTNEGVAIAIERAKQRKEEEEKRFEESKQAAKRKLQEIDEKRKNKQQSQTLGSSDSTSASNLDSKDSAGGHQHQDDQANQNANISLPEWDRDKDKENNDGKEQISSAPVTAPPTTNQLDNRRDLSSRDRDRDRDHDRDRDRDRDRERQRDRDMRAEREPSINVQQISVGGGGSGGGQSGGGSCHFKANLPPRFLKHQQQQQQQQQQQHGDQQRPGFFFRQNSAGSPQPLPWSGGSNSGSGGPNANHIPGGSNRSSGGRRNRNDSEVSDRERDDDLRGAPKSDRRDRHTPDGYDRDRPERYRTRGGPESSASSTSSSGGGNRLGGLSGGPYDGRGKGPPSSSGSGYFNGTSDYNRGYGRDYNRMDRAADREREMDTENDRHDRDSHYFDERDNEGDLKKLHDTFDGRDRDGRESDWRDNIDRRNDRERDRPQRPDSRDSRTSRDSRNSRDSMREETKSITESLLHDRSSWADSPYDPDPREEKMRRDDRRETSSGRNPPYMQQRHIPGPITREKLEASEQRNEAKRNLIPLVRSDKKAESLKKTDSQMDKAERKMTNDNENTSDVWSRNSNVTSVSSATPLVPLESESWADATEEVILKPSQSLAPTSGSTLDKHTTIKTELDDTKNTTELQPQQQLPQSLPSSSPPPPPSTPAQLPEEQTTQSSQKVSSVDSTDPSVKKSDESEISGRPEKSSGGRGGRGGRSNDGRSKDAWGNNTYAVYNRANYGPRGGESRGRRGSGRGVPRSHSARGCVHSESEVSGDEISVSASISTESGKEERRDRRDDRRIIPRSPKQGSRKPDRDDRNHDSRREGEKSYPSGSDGRRYDKRSSYDNSRNSTGSGGNREGFAPRGEPSRRGRGGFRTRGVTRVNTGSNCVYGAPRKPFFSSSDSTGKLDDKEKNLQAQSSSKDSEHNPDAMSSADDKMKLNQQALAAGIIGGRQNSKSSNVPPRMQRKSESEKRERRKSREGRGRARHLHQTHHGDPQQQGQTQRNDQGEDCAWETTSENSEGDDRDDNKHHDDNSRRRNYHSSRHPTSSGRTGRRNNPSSTARGGGDKRSYERKERNSGSGPPGGNSGNSQQMNGSGRQGPGGPGKNREINAGDNKSGDQHGLNRNEKDKANNLDGLDLTNIASVVIVDDQPEGSLEEDRSVFAADSGGFKEVRSKKNMKQQQGQKLVDEKPSASLRGGSGGNKDRNKSGPMKNSSANNQLPGSATVTSVGGGMQMNSQPSSKNYNSRPKKLPPRFERQKEKQKANQQQHQQQQQVQQQYDVAEMNKLNQSVTLFPIKDMPAPTATQNAWEKPIAPSLRNSSNSSPPAALQLTSALANSTDNSCSGGGGANTGVVDVQDRPQSGASSQRSSPTSNEKLVNKIGRETIEKAVLDGTTPPVQTIIFENTNYKSTPGDQIQAMKNKFKNQKMDRSRGGERKVESIEENSHTIGLSGYKPSGTDIKGQENKADPIQMPISFGKSEDSADMKLDFFDTELLTDDKTSKSISLQRSLNTAQNSAADLNFKIASVKKVWDQPPLGTGSVMEHHTEDGNVVSTSSSFTPTFGNAVEDPTSYVKPVDHSSVVQGEDGTSLNAGEIVYSGSGQCQTVPVPGAAGSYVSAVPNMMKPDAASSASSNVCKVKPQPAAAMPSNHSVQLSPPPYNSSSAQPGGHINYQATAQFNSMSAIPSPPTVLYNTHANQQMPAQGDIYQTAFQLSNTTPVLGGQARSQFTQFAGPYVSSLSSTNAFSQQSVYLHQTATHPPSAPPACPELYQTTLSQYRITAPPAAFGQSQQLNSNSPMLISSSANSHMSPTVVKPASQQIGAIGSKAPPYQASAPSQMYMYPDPMMSQNFLSNSQLMQQRPANNVVPQQIQASSSFYSAPAGSQTGGFFNPASSNLPSAAQQLHQTQFSMPYGSTQSPANLQNYGSQYRQPGPGPGGPNPSYLKSSNMTQQHVTDPAKSPSTNQPDVMNSVFSASQIPSPKSRSAGGGGGGSGPTKQPGQQPSPPQSHHKFSSYQTLPQALHQQQQSVQQQAVQQRGGQMSVTMVRGNVAGQTPRYPAPIQRPVPYQTLQQQTTNNPGNNNNSANNTSHNGNNNQGRHRQNTRIPPTSTQALINKMPPSPATSPYYSAGQAGGGGGNVSVKLDGPNANNNAVSNSTGGLESKNENICKVNDNSNAANKQQAATADSSKDPHDSHNTSATND